ncbi:MAG: amino acid dehydrogenase [Cyclobacteriaceae bacterium]|nr:amino acid dehydrogenase [Cyclobacteriaceae bacterium]
MENDFKALLQRYVQKKPEVIFEWNDPETEARGWVVINSLRGGAAGGGTRMRPGLDVQEVISLAKTMEIKFTVSGPPIGGAKSGIDFDPKDPRKKGVLKRWYQAVMPLMKYYYGTGGDLNIDERGEVIPITEDVGVWHPQEGVFKGYYKPSEAHLVNRIGQLRQGVVKVLENPKYSPDDSGKYTVADMITGFGVAASILHYYEIWGGQIKNKKVNIQGWGNVGAPAGLYLSRMGAKIICITDRTGGVVSENGFTEDEINKLFISREGNELVSQEKMDLESVSEAITKIGYEIFVPAAASRLISKQDVEKMIRSGVELISCGANVPFQDPEIFFGNTGMCADGNISVIPDFIANSGMARVFAFLMHDEVELSDEIIFEDTSKMIFNALKRTFDENPSKFNIAQRSFHNALKQLI